MFYWQSQYKNTVANKSVKALNDQFRVLKDFHASWTCSSWLLFRFCHNRSAGMSLLGCRGNLRKVWTLWASLLHRNISNSDSKCNTQILGMNSTMLYFLHDSWCLLERLVKGEEHNAPLPAALCSWGAIISSTAANKPRKKEKIVYQHKEGQ